MLLPSSTAATGSAVRLLGAPALLLDSAEQLFAPRRPFQLLAYLACRRTWVTRSELAELFWPDRPEGAARTNLRVLLQRVPRELAGVQLQAERVRWVVGSDLERLDAAAAAGRHAEVLALGSAALLEGLEPGLPEPVLEWLARERQRVDELRHAAAAAQRHAGPTASPLAATRDDDGFIGRRAELSQLQSLFAQDRRVVMVTGPGGVGKSALLRAALPLLAPARSGGALAVPLADLPQAVAVPARIAQALGLVPGPGADAWAWLAARIGPRDLLLVLDNAEHLDGLAAALSGLLGACPALRLLLSTRQRLDIDAPGQVATLALQGLPVPDDDETDPDTLRRFDAVRLFEARARATGGGLSLANEREAVLRVLKATDGLPLALELAAAATRLLPVPELARELARSLDVLDAGAGARGLRASFDRSWALLDAARQGAMARLAWLPGSFAHGMALQVAETPLADLAALADRSLLRADGTGRFSLHPLLRQFVAERSAPDVARLAARHAADVGHLLETLERVMDESALKRLDLELPHVLAAWAWAVAAGASSLLVRLARVMGRYAVVRGRAAEFLPLLAHAVAQGAAPGRAAWAARAATLRTQAMLEFHHSALADAEAHARQALRWAARAGDTGTAVACLTVLGNALLFSGRAAQARAPFEQARRRALERGDLSIASAASNGLGLVERAAGRFEAALALFHESLDIGLRGGDAAGQASTLLNIGNIEMQLQRWPHARQTTQQALALARASGASGNLAVLHTALCEIAIEMADLPAAHQHADAAATAQAHGSNMVVATQLPLMRMRIALAQGRADESAAALTQALAAARDSGSSTQQLSALNGVGRWLAAQGAGDEAARLWGLVQTHPETTHSLRATATRCLAAAGSVAAEVPAPADLPALLDRLLERLLGGLPARSIRS